MSAIVLRLGLSLKRLRASTSICKCLVYFIVRKNLDIITDQTYRCRLLGARVLSSYYIGFFETSQVDPQQYFMLFNESSKRTVVRFGVLNTMKHLMYFPLDSIAISLHGHLVFLVFRLGSTSCFAVKENKPYSHNLLQLAPYWTSPSC